MVDRQLRYLDYLPIDLKLLEETGLENDLAYKQQLYLAINTSSVEKNLSDYTGEIERLIEPGQVSTFRQLNFFLESTLAVLLTTSTIVSADSTELSPHYFKRSRLVPDHFQQVSSSYLEEVFYTSSKVWGGRYGSLGYYLYLSSNREHYLTVSQLTNLATNSLLNEMKVWIPDYSEYISSLLLSDFIEADRNLYRSTVEILEQFEGVPFCLRLLTFIESWVPKLMTWYLANSEQGDYRAPQEPQSDNAKQAYQTLTRVAQSVLNYAIDPSAEGVAYSFIHQTISPLYYSFIQDLIQIRKETIFIPSQLAKSTEELLVQELIEEIPLESSISVFKDTSINLLSQLAPPGGLNLWLVMVASCLLNRAYIISHPNNCSFVDEDLSLITNSLPPVRELYGRMMGLMFLAGYSLTKSNLSHLVILGYNLLTLSGQLTDRPVQIFDLTK